ncbi:MAG: HAD family phosphatase [Candidatus Magasanikiibacteriota bacterium]
MGIRAIIYDMDGLLVDSMIHWLDFDRENFGKYGVELTPEIVRQLTGGSGKENAKWIRENLIPSYTEEDYLSIRNEWMINVYKELTKLMPGAEKLVKYGREKGLKQAIASGAPLTVIDIVVERFDFGDHMDEFISADHVEHVGKPDPAIFLHTAKKLGVKPEECVVFEDAENGVVAAKRAGMKCIAVPDPRWSFGDFSQADLIVGSLEDPKVYKFLNLN